MNDVVAETFTTLWRRRFDVPERVLPWLYGVAANHVAHLRRAQSRRERLTGKLSANHGGPVRPPDDLLGVAHLLDRLPAGDAELLRLAYWEDLEPAEIAVVLAISPGTARVRLHRARRRAARQLSPIINPNSIIPDITGPAEATEEVAK